MPTNRQCAFCGSQRELTREHVFPKFFYSRDELKGDELAVSHVIQKGKEKVVQAELTIADVCRACNSGFLSRLDAYGAMLWDKFFDVTPRPGEAIRFEYNFDLLARWLLKLAYNAGRARKSEWPDHFLEYLRAHAVYIRGDGPRPPNLYLYLQLIRAAELTPQQKQSLLHEDGLDMNEIPPRCRRVNLFAMFAGPGKLKTGIVRGYLVEINAYVFRLVFWKPDLLRRQLQNSEREFLRRNPGTKRLYPDISGAVLYPSSVTIVDFIKSDPLRLSHAIEMADWLSRKDTK
jgi:hypothetical protein